MNLVLVRSTHHINAAKKLHNKAKHLQNLNNPILYAGKDETYKLYADVAKVYENSIALNTLGQHKKWRRLLVEEISPPKNSKILDAAGGTGLTTFEILDYSKNLNFGLNVTVCDMNSGMMGVGQEKVKIFNYDPKSVNWVKADINTLPFENETYDVFVITFGLRTGVNLNCMVREAFRVLKPGGKIGILDYCYSDYPTSMQWINLKYIEHISGFCHQLFWKNGYTMKYLAENIKFCPSKEQLTTILNNEGFHNITYQSRILGAVLQYVGQKPKRIKS